MSNATRKEGTKGTRMQVYTNSFEITRLPVKRFYHYDVIDPEVKVIRRSFEIMDRLQTRVAPQVFNPRAVFDGRKNLYSSHELQLNSGAGSFDVVMSDKPVPPGSVPRGLFKIKIVRASASAIEPSDLNDLIRGGKETPRTKTATNLLQLLIRAAPNMKYPHNSKSYFTDVGKKSIGGGLELWTGFFQSVRPSIGRMLVNIDVTMATMIRSGALPDVALDILGRTDYRALQLTERSQDFRKLKSMLKNVVITVKTDPKRKRSIKDLVPNAGRLAFEKTDASGNSFETTVMDHYRDAYDIRLRYPDLFGISVGSRERKIVFPAELCTIVEGQISKKKVPPELTKQVVEFATRRPEERLKAIGQGIDGRNQLQTPVLEYENSDFINDAQMKISQSPLQVSGRVLDTPRISYRGDDKNPRFGSWNVVGSQFRSPSSLSYWGVINFSHSNTHLVQGLVNTLMSCCSKLGMNVSPPIHVQSAEGNPEKHLAIARDEIMKRTPPNMRPQLILTILPQSAADLRRAIKHWGDVTNGIATQCIREDKLRKANDQYCNNVALKVNIRLGGVNSIIALGPHNVMQKLRREPFMIIGCDVSHPGPGVKDQPSVASLVWSHDPDASSYVAYSSVQPPRQEKFGALQPMVHAAMVAFIQKNKAPPSNMVFFRDGVSEGEYEAVMKEEISAVGAAIDAIWRNAPPGTKNTGTHLTFIVVGKRHHIRFFPQGNDGDRKSGNCPAGFCADKGLSNPIAFDFYLQSHGGLLGTSRPAHYVVLRDDIFGGQVDDLQELAFTLCHVYARATRSVSIPAPVYYADLVCSRGKDFYFDDSLRYGDDMTTSSGGQTFDLNKWMNGFKGSNIHQSMNKTMYFL